MLRIKHPAAIVRDREKQVSQWEGVRFYKYANGVECQILVGQLPHGHIQSVVSANRSVRLEGTGADVQLVFGDDVAPIVDFLAGDRPREESVNTCVLDACHFVPSARVKVKQGKEELELSEQGALLVARFADGAVVEIEPHGSHGHVKALRDGVALKTFFHGPDATLYLFGAANPAS